eukprot:GDKK01054962.1.p1 GENE.GDKK01054962.1~~GDKK01054962.1.p1  ORF type:complete len:593 (-),score=136.07 GDKK01054962.1:101-1879(-)
MSDVKLNKEDALGLFCAFCMLIFPHLEKLSGEVRRFRSINTEITLQECYNAFGNSISAASKAVMSNIGYPDADLDDLVKDYETETDCIAFQEKLNQMVRQALMGETVVPPLYKLPSDIDGEVLMRLLDDYHREMNRAIIKVFAEFGSSAGSISKKGFQYFPVLKPFAARRYAEIQKETFSSSLANHPQYGHWFPYGKNSIEILLTHFLAEHSDFEKEWIQIEEGCAAMAEAVMSTLYAEYGDKDVDAKEKNDMKAAIEELKKALPSGFNIETLISLWQTYVDTVSIESFRLTLKEFKEKKTESIGVIYKNSDSDSVRLRTSEKFDSCFLRIKDSLWEKVCDADPTFRSWNPEGSGEFFASLMSNWMCVESAALSDNEMSNDEIKEIEDKIRSVLNMSQSISTKEEQMINQLLKTFAGENHLEVEVMSSQETKKKENDNLIPDDFDIVEYANIYNRFAPIYSTIPGRVFEALGSDAGCIVAADDDSKSLKPLLTSVGMLKFKELAQEAYEDVLNHIFHPEWFAEGFVSILKMFDSALEFDHEIVSEMMATVEKCTKIEQDGLYKARLRMALKSTIAANKKVDHKTSTLLEVRN